MPVKPKAASLETYAKKRDFEKTPEPSGVRTRSAAGKKPRFVVQMHRATRLHYDFRLEADGVLKSWAIPKGPTFDTREKRFAVAVEDHPLDYRDFEGIIPKGNYGAGEVIVWDRGTYRLLEGDDVTEQIAKGSVKIEMSGEKLHGGFALVHIKGRNGEENAWLLIKERDDAVDPSWRVEEHATSVKSGKTLEDFARDPNAPHWDASGPADAQGKRTTSEAAGESTVAATSAKPVAEKATVAKHGTAGEAIGTHGSASVKEIVAKRDDAKRGDAKRGGAKRAGVKDTGKLDVAAGPAAESRVETADAARRSRSQARTSESADAKPGAARATASSRAIEPLPEIASPMLATAVDAAFDDPNWLFELKWDGYRALVTIAADGAVSVASRNGKDFTTKFPELAKLAESFSERPIIVDGEIVVLDVDGRPSFSALQERLDRFGRSAPDKAPVTFVAFDLPYGSGRDLRDEPLETRKAALEAIVTGRGPAMYSKHVERDGKDLFALAAERGLEGIVAKKRASPYRSTRSRDWLKVKAIARQEFVIGGWTEGRGSREYFGALLIGTFDGDAFVYAGSVGTGFDRKKLAAIAKLLEPLERKTAPFATTPKTESRAHWVSATLVAEISFTEWTRDGQLRHPVFVAMRSDKTPRDVVRERPA